MREDGGATYNNRRLKLSEAKQKLLPVTGFKIKANGYGNRLLNPGEKYKTSSCDFEYLYINNNIINHII